jgi:hypothetical protein
MADESSGRMALQALNNTTQTRFLIDRCKIGRRGV